MRHIGCVLFYSDLHQYVHPCWFSKFTSVFIRVNMLEFKNIHSGDRKQISPLSSFTSPSPHFRDLPNEGATIRCCL